MHSGKPRRKVVLLLLVVVAAALGWLLFFRSGEPEYDSHHVSYWFREYCYSRTEQPYHDDDEKSVDYAFSRMGTNAVPYLLTVALDTNEDSAVWKFTKDFFDNVFPDSHHRPRFLSHGQLQDRATRLIGSIKPPAAMVLPSLRQNLNQTNTAAYEHAIELLGDIADPSNAPAILAPIFAGALHNPSRVARNNAIEGLYSLGSNALAATPELTQYLADSSISDLDRASVALVLGKCGTNALIAVSALQDSFTQDSDPQYRTVFAAAIARIDPSDTEAFSYLTNALTNRADERTLLFAAWRLKYAGPRAGNAIPALLDDLDTTNESVWSRVYETLISLNAPTNLLLAKVRDSLYSESETICINSARILLERNHTDSAAQAALGTIIQAHSTNEPDAVDALSEAGPTASNTVPILLSVIDGTNTDSWINLADALVRIGAGDDIILPKLEAKIATGDHPEETAFLFDITSTILQRSPGDRPAQLALLPYLTNEYALSAIHRLKLANPPAPEVLPALRQVLNSQSQAVRDSAAEAIKKIESRQKTK